MPYVPCPDSDLFDQIGIVTLKIERLNEASLTLQNKALLDALQRLRDLRYPAEVLMSVSPLIESLNDINRQLWDMETAIRKLDSHRQLAEIADLTERIIQVNDSRAAIKKTLALELDSPLVEEKSHSLNSEDFIACPAREPLLLESDIGSVMDKVSILELKQQHCPSKQRRLNVSKELELINEIKRDCFSSLTEAQVASLTALQFQLREVNQKMWAVQDALRAPETLADRNQTGRLGLAVIDTNARRNELKKAVNSVLTVQAMANKSGHKLQP